MFLSKSFGELTRIKKARIGISLAFAVLLIMTILFVGGMGNKIIELQMDIIAIEEYAAGERNKALEDMIEKQHSYVKSIQDGWEKDINGYGKIYGEGNIPADKLVEKLSGAVSTLMNQSKDSLIVGIQQGDNIDIFKPAYVHESYERILSRVSSFEPMKYGELRVCNGPELGNGNFGDYERVFTSGTTLSYAPDDLNINIFVIFDEQIAFNTFIDTVSAAAVLSIKQGTQTILILLGGYLLFVSVISTSLLVSLRQAQTEVDRVGQNCPKYGSDDCAASYILFELMTDKEKVKKLAEIASMPEESKAKKFKEIQDKVDASTSDLYDLKVQKKRNKIHITYNLKERAV